MVKGPLVELPFPATEELLYRAMGRRWALRRYLARDWGATLDLSREFNNGLRIGVWITRTTASSEQ